MSHRSLEGLAATLKAVLERHAKEAQDPPEPAPAAKYARLDDVPVFRRRHKLVACVHCHYIQEDLRLQEMEDGTWKRENLWAYPPPENWGITMSLREPARIASVLKGSSADRAGLRAGDVLRRVGVVGILSWGDLFFAIQSSPQSGEVEVAYEREGRRASARLALQEGWRRYDLTWRPSLEAALPNPGFRIRELAASEKKPLGLAADALAGRVGMVMMAGPAKPAGLQDNDVVVSLGVGEKTASRRMDDRQFQAWFRTECSPGDQVKIGFLRGGQRKETILELER